MLSRGSKWRRWEQHIHAPGTVRNNQFSGPAAWTDYLTALEGAAPIDYDGVDIRKLSPGTCGIVPLLLYLALDDSDNRPLVIDQLEENLDS